MAVGPAHGWPPDVGQLSSVITANRAWVLVPFFSFAVLARAARLHGGGALHASASVEDHVDDAWRPQPRSPPCPHAKCTCFPDQIRFDLIIILLVG